MSVIRAGSSVDHACDHLYRCHQMSLVNFARVSGCDEHEAWDLVQDLFLRLFCRGMIQPLYSHPEEIQRAMLLRTLRWILINLNRHRSRLRRGGGQTPESLEMLMEQGVEFATRATPSSEYDRQWAHGVMDRCLSRLRGSIRPAAWHAFESSLHGTELSGSSAKRVAAHRARARLRQMIRIEASEEALLCAVTAQN